MALIRIACDGCHAVLQAPAELGGTQGTCPKCEGVILIPAVGVRAPVGDVSPVGGGPPLPAALSALATTSLALSQATAPEMMAEIHRRNKSAVLVVFETPKTGAYDLNRQANANVRCYRTEEMSDAQLMQVLEQVSLMSQGARNQKGGIVLQGDAAPLPFELKGDRLGMTLEEFKAKYARKVGGIAMPYCSDAAPGQANSTLWTEPWHAAAGLVTGRVDLPSENASPTVAGVKSELMLYHFVDGRLFRISALVDTEAFHLIREAVAGKHGPPTSEVKEPLELSWRNAVSTIRLVRGTMRPKKASLLQLIHHELQKTAEGRLPKREADL